MKNIVALIGSLRKESINRQVYEHYSELAKESLSITEIPIADFPHYNADIEPFPPQVLEAANKIKAADGLIFFSPEYNYSIPGMLKNALDWLSRCENKPFDNKPATIIGASPGAIATARMQYHLRQVAVFLNLRVMNKPEVMIGGAYDKIKDHKVIDDGTVQFLKKHVVDFDQFVAR